MRPIKRAIILCWIMLVACFIIKLFGGNWFEVVCTNEHFSNLCRFIDNNVVLRSIVGFILYVPSTFLVLVSSSFLTKPNKKQLLFLILFVSSVWCLNFIDNTIKGIVEFVMILISPILVKLFDKNCGFANIIKNRWYYGIVANVIVLVFQMISLIIRNVGIKVTHDSLLITSILMIDYYIMVLLYYLYIKEKGVKKDG